MTNTIMIINPYWYSGTWVFDDATRGLDKEPFVENIPEMIDDLVSDIRDARKGFRLLFSSSPFPGHQRVISYVRPEYDGHWYRDNKTSAEGWLCGSLMAYFDKAPAKIYIKAERL